MTAARDLVTAAEAARRADVPAGTVRSWVSTGRLHPAGIGDAGERLFDLQHVRALATTTNRRTR